MRNGVEREWGMERRNLMYVDGDYVRGSPTVVFLEVGLGKSAS